MAIDVNAIMEALLTRLDGDCAGTFKTVTRRPKRQWAIEEHPALELFDNGREDRVGDSDDPAPVWRLGAELVLHAWHADGENVPTTIQLNDLVKTVRESLEVGTDEDPSNGYTNLGGLVRYLSIVSVEKGLGEQTGRPQARITLEMEAQ